MSALPPKADISRTSRHVRYVPTAEVISSLVAETLWRREDCDRRNLLIASKNANAEPSMAE
jgi:hypothetical protein